MKMFRKSSNAGFTLIELMVVVAIIAVLVAVGLPKMSAYLRTSETTEAIEIAGRIVKALQGYVDSHNEITSGADFTTRFDTYPNLSQTGNTTSQVTQIIPHLNLPNNSNFQYVIDAAVNNDRNVRVCIRATRVTSAGAVVPGYGPIYISNEAATGATAAEWEGTIYRRHYIANLTGAIPAGGACDASGAVVPW